MQVYHNIQEMIGRTPIMELTHMDVKEGVHVYVKLELMNPAGSVKDRVGMYMVEDAEREELLWRPLREIPESESPLPH